MMIFYTIIRYKHSGPYVHHVIKRDAADNFRTLLAMFLGHRVRSNNNNNYNHNIILDKGQPEICSAFYRYNILSGVFLARNSIYRPGHSCPD